MNRLIAISLALVLVAILIPESLATEDAEEETPLRVMPDDLDDDDDYEARGSRIKFNLFSRSNSDAILLQPPEIPGENKALADAIREKRNKVLELYIGKKDFKRALKKVNQYIERFEPVAERSTNVQYLEFVAWLMRHANMLYREMKLQVPALLQAHELRTFAEKKLTQKEVQGANNMLARPREELTRLVDKKIDGLLILAKQPAAKNQQLNARFKKLDEMLPEEYFDQLDEESQGVFRSLQAKVETYKRTILIDRKSA